MKCIWGVQHVVTIGCYSVEEECSGSLFLGTGDMCGVNKKNVCMNKLTGAEIGIVIAIFIVMLGVLGASLTVYFIRNKKRDDEEGEEDDYEDEDENANLLVINSATGIQSELLNGEGATLENDE